MPLVSMLTSHSPHPSFKGFGPGTLLYVSEVSNRLPSSAYPTTWWKMLEASWPLLSGVRSLAI